jgi:hypothetical protein
MPLNLQGPNYALQLPGRCRPLVYVRHDHSAHSPVPNGQSLLPFCGWGIVPERISHGEISDDISAETQLFPG